MLYATNQNEIDNLTLNTNRLSCKKEQKDLGIIMATNLNRKANCDKRCSKSWRVFYFLTRNVSKLANKNMKLNAYKGYVVPVIAYASQAWSANKGEMRDIEKSKNGPSHGYFAYGKLSTID